MAVLTEQTGLRASKRFIIPVAGVMLIVGAMMIAVILYSARTMDENIVTSQAELFALFFRALEQVEPGFAGDPLERLRS